MHGPPHLGIGHLWKFINHFCLILHKFSLPKGIGVEAHTGTHTRHTQVLHNTHSCGLDGAWGGLGGLGGACGPSPLIKFNKIYHIIALFGHGPSPTHTHGGCAPQCHAPHPHVAPIPMGGLGTPPKRNFLAPQFLSTVSCHQLN